MAVAAREPGGNRLAPKGAPAGKRLEENLNSAGISVNNLAVYSLSAPSGGYRNRYLR